MAVAALTDGAFAVDVVAGGCAVAVGIGMGIPNRPAGAEPCTPTASADGACACAEPVGAVVG